MDKTSLKEAMASTTSFVNVFPTPDDPIRTVGFIAWRRKENGKNKERDQETFKTCVTENSTKDHIIILHLDSI